LAAVMVVTLVKPSSVLGQKITSRAGKVLPPKAGLASALK
jgi:hypothetical protein